MKFMKGLRYLEQGLLGRKVYRNDNGKDLPPYFTIIIFIAGVIGGLIVIISVIVFCKYCIKRKKQVLKRQPVLVARHSSERTTKQRPEYETVDLAEIKDTRNGHHDHRRRSWTVKSTMDIKSKSIESNDDENEIDNAVAKYRESIIGGKDVRNVDVKRFDRDSKKFTPPSAKPADTRRENYRQEDTKHVSFLLADNASSPPTTSRNNRYTDGDYHHLKSAKINRSQATANFAKHRSMTAPEIDHFPHERDSNSFEDSATEVTPMLTTLTDDSSNDRPHTTEVVAVEVHRDPRFNDIVSIGRSHRSSSIPTSSSRSKPPPEKTVSRSVDVCFPTPRRPPLSRRAYSCDVGHADRQFHRGPFYNADYDVISERGSPELEMKVRYNDMGSLEEINYDNVDLLDQIVINALTPEHSDNETVNGTRTYRELWNLRTTLEEEEVFSDTIRMEDMTSPETQSAEERDHMTSVNTSFESSIDPRAERVCRRSGAGPDHDDPVIRKAASSVHTPEHNDRRETYRSILSKRLKRSQGSTENSFDSVETMETDGEVSESSRYEVTTTSFDSTTTNTDSTSEGNAHKLQQMRGDSGYKSLETQQSTQAALPTRPVKKQIHFADTIERVEHPRTLRKGDYASLDIPLGSGASWAESPMKEFSKAPKETCFDRGRAKTASKKRRDYRRERQIIHVYDSIHEPETDSKSDQPSGDSFEESLHGRSPKKLPFFSRFLKYQSKEPRRVPLIRDFSVDEKTNAIFNEFMRYDPKMETGKTYGVRQLPRGPHHSRLHRKHTEPVMEFGHRREKLTLSMRSASLGSDSSIGSRRRISPQDSIEEEYTELEPPREKESPLVRSAKPSRRNSESRRSSCVRLTEEESADV